METMENKERDECTAHLSAFCPSYHQAIELIGRRWTGAILRAMLSGEARFSDIASVSPGQMQSWGRILCAVPGARLLWMNRELDEPATIARVRASLRQHGVATDRVELIGDADTAARPGLLERIDVLLDSSPMSEPRAICDALAMGVPVVTLAGQHSAGRSGASVLSAAAWGEGTAGDAAEFVSLAIALARRGVRSAEDRRALRDAVASSSLCNVAGFAKQLDAAFRRIWERFCGV